MNLGYFWFCQFNGASGEWLLIFLGETIGLLLVLKKSSWLLVKLSWIFWLWKYSCVFGKSKLNLGYFWFRQFTGASGEWLLIVLTPKPDWTASKIIWLPKCVLNSAAISPNVVLKFWWLLVHFTQAVWICTVNYIFKCIVIEHFSQVWAILIETYLALCFNILSESTQSQVFL